jgi:sulfur carrier protein ThiS
MIKISSAHLPSSFANVHSEETLEIHLQLYSILREKLPAEAKGRAILQLNEGATLQDLLNVLGIERRVVISVNDVLELDDSRQLIDGDEVKIFSSISGG